MSINFQEIISRLSPERQDEIRNLSTEQFQEFLFNFLNNQRIPRNINIGCKPPQSGKTNEFIIRPTLNNIDNDILTIIIVPSRISLEKQTAERFVNETMTNDGDDSFYTANDEPDEILNVEYLEEDIIRYSNDISHKNIGRYDTGIPLKERLKGPADTLKRFKSKDIRLMIILDNSQGIKKLCSLLAYIDKFKPEQKVHMISDEVHGLMNLKLTTIEKLNFNRNISSIQEKIDNNYENGLITSPGEFHAKKSMNLGWLFTLLDRKSSWKFTGTTATVSLLTQNSLIRQFGFGINVSKGNIPDCYIGYEQCKKKYYVHQDPTDVFDNIICTREEFATVMYHSGRFIASHIKAGLKWIECCINQDIDQDKICYMTDNKDGYVIYDYNNDIVKSFSKKEIDEPWRVVMYAQERYTHIGIFGDIAMSESNTYQKCNLDYNVVLTDIIVKHIDDIKLENMTSIIQKVGRIFTNDTINGNLKRTIWFHINKSSNKNDKKHFENALKIEKHIQNKSETSNLLGLDFKIIKKKVISGIINSDGDEIEQEQEQEPDSLIQGIIIILQENNRALSSREVFEKIEAKGWFRTFLQLRNQISTVLGRQQNSNIFIKNGDGKFLLNSN